jgi:hypothetical protein
MALLRLRATVNSTFNVQKILRAQRRKEFQRLRTAGAYVRTTASQSMKGGPGKSSPAGKPPRSHTRRLKKSIRFEVALGQRLVRIGPAALGTAAGAQALQAIELGGWSNLVRKGRRTKRIRITPHPFMGPALDKETPKLPAIWAN